MRSKLALVFCVISGFLLFGDILAMAQVSPSITSQPLSQSLHVGQEAVFNVTAAGSGPLAFQWLYNGSPLSGQTNNSLSLTNIQPSMAGEYSVAVTNVAGSVVSELASLSVNQVVAFGGNNRGECDVPPGLAGVRTIASFGVHTLALRHDGTVVGWGFNDFPEVVNVPTELEDVTAISAGIFHSVALRNNGTVVCWGYDLDLLGAPEGLSQVAAIEAGSEYTLALKEDGTVVTWGNNSYLPPTGVPPGLSGVVSIAAGNVHSLALKEDGTVVAWGNNTFGQTNVPSGLSGVVALAAGHNHSLALKDNGTVVAWGWNSYGQTNVPLDLDGVVAIAAGSLHSVALKEDGSVVAWGLNDQGQTEVPAGLGRVAGIAAGEKHTVVLLESSDLVAPFITKQPQSQGLNARRDVTLTVQATGSEPFFYQWLKDGIHLFGQTNDFLSLFDVQPSMAGTYSVTVSNLVGSVSSDLASLQVNEVVAWGTYANSITGTPDAPAGLSGVRGIAAGADHSLALKNDGTVVAWGGANSYGQTNVPGDLGDVAAISAGSYHSLALKNHGTVVAWGRNDNGETEVPLGLDQATAISAGDAHSVALKDDGTVVAWGLNNSGQADVPANLSGVVAIAAGYYHSVALKADGTVVVWGSNLYGQRNVPVDLAGVVDISAGIFHTAALKDDGTVIVWGSDGGFYSAPPPVGLSGVVDVEVGGYIIYALKNDGTVVSWGPSGPEVPPGLSGVLAISASYGHGLALLANTDPVAPFILYQPRNHAVQVGDEVSFRVRAEGNEPLSFQWQKNGTNLVGEISPYLHLPDVQLAGAGNYRVVITNNYGMVSSREASLAVELRSQMIQFDNLPPLLTTDPVFALDATASSGLPVAYSTSHPEVATINGNMVTIVGEGTTTITAMQPGNSTYAAAPEVSRVLKVLAYEPLLITQQPEAQNANAGQDVTFLVLARGNGLVEYQWRRDGAHLVGQTNSFLSLTNVQPHMVGEYSVVVTSQDGSITSVGVALSVNVVVAWGLNDVGQTDVPPGLDGIRAIATGFKHTLALKNDGTVVAWGLNTLGQSTVPEGLDHVVDVVAGHLHSVALKDDGTVSVWGGIGFTRVTDIPPGLSAVKAIAGRGNHILALKDNGTVVAWGSNSGGATNVPSGLSGVVSIAAGNGHSLALKDDGTVVAWGLNNHGQTNVPSGLSGVMALAAGNNHSLALKDDGTVVAWGRNDYGQTNVPLDLHGVVALSAYDHNLALKDDGSVVVWGDNNYEKAQAPPGLEGVVDVAAGVTHTAVLLRVSDPVPPFITRQPQGQSVDVGQEVTFEVLATEGDFFSYQWQYNGLDLDSATNAVLTLDHVQTHQTGLYTVVVSSMSGSTTSSAACLTVQQPIGTVVVWGSNSSGQTDVPELLSGVKALAAGRAHSLALGRDGTVSAWGYNDHGQTNIPAGLLGVAAVSSSDLHNLALKEDGTVVAWGYNGYGQATVPPSLNGVVAIAAGHGHSVAVRSNSSIVVWGLDSSGQADVPEGLQGVTAVSAGYAHTLALQSNGKVVAWGYSLYGGTNVPDGLSNVVAIAAGGGHNVALKGDGTVVAWGLNNHGQADVPANLSGVVAIAAGHNHTVALKNDGTVLSWGENTGLQTNVPAGLVNVKAIAAGGGHTMALRNDGTLLVAGPEVGVNSYQWRRNGVSIHGATNANYRISQSFIKDPALYQAFVSGPGGKAESESVRLISDPAPGQGVPQILSQPDVIQTLEGRSLVMGVVAAGDASLTYNWTRNAELFPDGNGLSILTFTNIQPSDAGIYQVTVSNALGSAQSKPMELRVLQAVIIGPPGKEMPPVPGNGFELLVDSVSGQEYVVEANGSLDAAGWLEIHRFNSQGDAVYFLDQAASSMDRRFYRVIRASDIPQ